MLNATLHSHLNDHNSQIAKDIKIDLYVDKFISGRDTEEEAVQYYNEARSIMTEVTLIYARVLQTARFCTHRQPVTT
jgi:hypothetical protein